MDQYTTSISSDLNTDIPVLPSSISLPNYIGIGVCPWLDDYIDFSRKWSPRAYDGFHEACGIWLLSTIASRRVSTHLGKQRFTNIYIAFVARTSFFAKTTTVEIAIQTMRQAGLDWLLAADEATPQKFVSDMANQDILNYEQLDEERKDWMKLRTAFAAQRGWYYEEFGQKISAMMSANNYMAPFRGLIRRLDDTPERYESGTLLRGGEVIINPYLSLMANITPSDLRSYAKKGAELWGDGFLARFGLVTPVEGTRSLGRFPSGKRVIPQHLIASLVEWHKRLGVPEITLVDLLDKKKKPTGNKRVEVHRIPLVEISITSEVEDAFYTYHDGLLDSISNPKNFDLDGNYARMAEKALRIALLLSSVNGKEEIERPEWYRAQEITERWRMGLHEAYSQINQPPPSRERENEDSVLDIIKKLEKATAAEVARYNRSLSSTELRQILDGLVNVGILEVIETTRKGTKRYGFFNEPEK